MEEDLGGEEDWDDGSGVLGESSENSVYGSSTDDNNNDKSSVSKPSPAASTAAVPVDVSQRTPSLSISPPSSSSHKPTHQQGNEKKTVGDQKTSPGKDDNNISPRMSRPEGPPSANIAPGHYHENNSVSSEKRSGDVHRGKARIAERDKFVTTTDLPRETVNHRADQQSQSKREPSYPNAHPSFPSGAKDGPRERDKRKETKRKKVTKRKKKKKRGSSPSRRAHERRRKTGGKAKNKKLTPSYGRNAEGNLVRLAQGGSAMRNWMVLRDKAFTYV